MAETKVVDKVAESIVESQQRIAEMLDRAIPKDTLEIIKQREADYEDPVVVSEDRVAVLDISTGALEACDGWPGYYDVVRQGEFTKANEPIKDRYAIVVNYIPSVEVIQDLNIVPRKEWEATVKSKPNYGISVETQIAGLMRRSAGAI